MSADPKRPTDPVLAKLFRIADLLLTQKKEQHNPTPPPQKHKKKK